jgi:hypothetical protein
MCVLVHMNPLVGMAVFTSFLCWYFCMCVMCIISRTGYIYILVFCDDPFFHLRAHPTQVRVLGQMR